MAAASVNATLLEGLPNPEMMKQIQQAELGIPAVSEVLDALADEKGKYTLFLPSGVSCLPPPGVPVESYLLKLVGEHTVRGVHSIASLSRGAQNLVPLLKSDIKVASALVNGQKMLKEYSFVNGNLILVSNPLVQLSPGGIGAGSGQRPPYIEDIICVPTVDCAHCGVPKPTVLADGALFCTEEHAKLGVGDKVDEEARVAVLPVPSTGSKILAISGPYDRRRGRWRRRGRGWPYYYGGGYYDYYPPYAPAVIPTPIPGLAVVAEDGKTAVAEPTVDCHMGKKHKKGKRSQQDVGDEVGAPFSRDPVTGKRRLRRRKSDAEMDAKQRERDARARRKAKRSERRESKEDRRAEREGRRSDAEKNRRDRQRRQYDSESGSSSSSSGSESESDMPPPPPPVRSIRELLATKNMNPSDLVGLQEGLEFEHEADQIFYDLAVGALAAVKK